MGLGLLTGYVNLGSPSSQRVWIEIHCSCQQGGKCQTSPSSQRVWIEISSAVDSSMRFSGRPLHRGCGLKYKTLWLWFLSRWSPSSQRVWIEIISRYIWFAGSYRRPLHRGCGLKSVSCGVAFRLYRVALFTEGVDWNSLWFETSISQYCRPLHRGCGLKSGKGNGKTYSVIVALFTEGVDWNGIGVRMDATASVALFTEGVDWNIKKNCWTLSLIWSPSSQRVWIEI